jgi:hypothetical protein
MDIRLDFWPTKRPGRAALASPLAVVLLSAGLGGAAADSAVSASPRAAAPDRIKIATRRLTESQYRHTIRDLFGEDIKIDGRFEPEKREAGLLAIGRADLSVTTSGLEQYFAMAQSIAGQALEPERRERTVGCAPAAPARFDRACAAKFVAGYGERLFRRPLVQGEIAARLAAAEQGMQRTGDFYGGLKLALASLLVAPEFLFRVETAERDPADPKAYRLDGYSKASRLSFLFWDAPPDAGLLEAARTGAIHRPEVLAEQVARLSASPRLKEGVRAFFTDMLQLDQFDGLVKDTKTYPKFSQAVADSAREEVLRTVVEQLVTRQRDYRELFTTNETILNRHLAAIYRVPFRSSEDWAPYTFSDSSGRSGLLTQVAFLSLFSHPGVSSPTRRGIKLREIFLCLPTPDPPPNVDFSKVQALDKGTVRERLTAHMDNPVCAGCHKISDPPGLALERFDGLGQLRTMENGQLIDVDTTFNGVPVSGARGLGQALHEDPQLSACLVRNVFAYGVGHDAKGSDESYLDATAKAFAAGGYRLAGLMTRMATSPEFFRVTYPDMPAGGAIAQLTRRAPVGERP